MTGERLPPHDKAVMTNAIVTAKVMAREQHNNRLWRKICSQLPEIVDRINSGALSPGCCDAEPTLGEVINFYWNHKTEIHSVLDPKLERLPDLQAMVAAQWQAVIEAAPDGSPEDWRRSLVADYGYTDEQMRRGPAGIIRRLVDNIQGANRIRDKRARDKGER